MEQRKTTNSKSSPLPPDYLQMVSEVFSSHFDAGLKIYHQIKPNPSFEIRGEVFSDEIVLSVSLVSEGQLAATTVYASADFDPKASSPTAQDLLSACVDAVGAVFEPLLSPDHPEVITKLAEESLSALEDVPFQWAPVEANQRKIYVKIDKSNPKLDHLADDWLAQHDPDFKERTEREQKETESLFVTGPHRKSNGKNDPGNSLH